MRLDPVRIGKVTLRPRTGEFYRYEVVVKENGWYRMATFQHVGNDYIGCGDGSVQLAGLRYERIN